METTGLAAHYSGPGIIRATEHEAGLPGPAEVLLSVNACGICGTDLHFYAGRWPQPSITPGHEIAGTVSDTGDGVAAWRVGDHVCVEPTLWCGSCVYCLRGETNRCQELKFLSVDRDGGFATRLIVPERCLHRVPAGIPDTVAALIEPLAVAIHACRTAPVQPGDTVVICGLGSIGLLTSLAAQEAGAALVLASGRHEHQRNAARSLGADPVAPDELEAAVRDWSEGLGADVVIETIGGAGQAVGQALGSVRTGGTVVLAGGFTRPSSVHLGRVVNREIRMVGSSCYSHSLHPDDFAAALEIAGRRQDDLASLVTHQFTLDQIQDAFAAAADKSSGAIKVQVRPTAA
jgi:2-desacetyl-2-hydroxyethyl bacteriochlorophyllide A dehydrogenase